MRSRAEYDRKIAVPRRQFWGGRDLPFRVLLDRPDLNNAEDREPEGTGTTVARYGITGFPTVLVIDSDGTIVGTVPHFDHGRLETLIEERLKKAESH